MTFLIYNELLCLALALLIKPCQQPCHYHNREEFNKLPRQLLLEAYTLMPRVSGLQARPITI